MTAHPAEPVPDADPDEATVAAAALQEYREWVAKGRPGAVSHEEAMAELLGDALSDWTPRPSGGLAPVGFARPRRTATMGEAYG